MNVTEIGKANTDDAPADVQEGASSWYPSPLSMVSDSEKLIFQRKAHVASAARKAKASQQPTTSPPRSLVQPSQAALEKKKTRDHSRQKDSREINLTEKDIVYVRYACLYIPFCSLFPTRVNAFECFQSCEKRRGEWLIVLRAFRVEVFHMVCFFVRLAKYVSCC